MYFAKFIFISAFLFLSVATYADPIPLQALLGSGAACNELSASSFSTWSSIIGYWKLNDTVGSGTAADSGPVGTNTGTATSVTFGVTGRLKTAATFNGTTSFISLTSSSNYIPSTNHAMTIAVWANPSSISAPITSNRILSLHQGATAGSTFALSLGNSNQIQYFNQASNTTTIWTHTISTNAWTHIAITYNGTCFQRYYNGRADGTCTTAGLTAGGSFAGKVGTYDGTAYYYAGKLDDLMISGTALTAVQIKSLYDQQSCGKN